MDWLPRQPGHTFSCKISNQEMYIDPLTGQVKTCDLKRGRGENSRSNAIFLLTRLEIENLPGQYSEDANILRWFIFTTQFPPVIPPHTFLPHLFLHCFYFSLTWAPCVKLEKLLPMVETYSQYLSTYTIASSEWHDIHGNTRYSFQRSGKFI